MNGYSIPCAVTADLNRYMRQMDRADARHQAVKERAEELQQAGSEYDPFCASNVAEALGEFDGTAYEALAKLLNDGNTAGAGLALDVLVKDYWNRLATQKAEREIMAASCGHCFDRGCYRCDPPEPEWS